MSIILAYKKGDKVYMATDTAVTANGYLIRETSEDNFKIRKSPGGILVGVTGERGLRQEIFSLIDEFTLDKNGNLTKKHIASEIVPKLYFHLMDNEMLEKPDDNVPYMKASVLIAFKDQIFDICNDFSVYRYMTYQAHGEASDFISYALAHVDNTKDITEQMIKIMKLAEKHCKNIRRPFVMINTEEIRFRLWEE